MTSSSSSPSLLVCLTVLVLMTVCAVQASPSKPFGKEESDHISAIVNREINTAVASSSAKDLFFSLSSQKLLSSNSKADNGKFCSVVADELKKTTQVEKVYYASQLLDLLDCPSTAVVVDADASTFLSEILADDSASISDLFYATGAALTLNRKKLLEFNKAELSQVISVIENSFSRKGLVSVDKKDSFFFTGLSFSVLSQVAKATKLAESDLETLSILAENAETALSYSSASSDSDGSAYFDDGDSRTAFRVSYALLSGAYALREASNSEFFFDPEIINSVAEFFLFNVLHINNGEDAYYFLKALNFFAKNKISKPLVLDLLTETVSLGSKSSDNLVKVRVTDLFGTPITDGNVYLIKASKLFSTDKVVVSNQELAKDSTTGEFALNFLSQKPEPTFYTLDFSVKTSAGSISSTSRLLKVSTSVSVSSIDLTISDEDIKNGKKHSITEGGKFNDLSANYFNILTFHFNVKSVASSKTVVVHQAFVRFYSAAADAEAIFPAKASAKGYELSIKLKDSGKDFLFATGSFEVELIIGDAFIENSLVWHLGSISLTFPPNLKVEKQSFFDQKNPIHHIFRSPEKRPPAELSLAFTALTISPWLILLGGLAKVGMNFGSISFGKSLSSLLFLFSIAATFALFVLYWLSLNMFQTLNILGLISVVTFFSGYLSLRVKKQKVD